MRGRVVTTVVTPATDISLIDLDDLKSDLQISGTTDDTFLTRTILKASAAAAAYCNRTLVVETVSDRWIAAEPYQHLFGLDAQVLQLSRYPVVTPTSVSSNGVTTVSNPIAVMLTGCDGSTTSLMLDIDFIVDTTLGELIRLDSAGRQIGWPSSGVTVVYSAGYSPVPMDMQDAVTNLVKARIAARTRDPLLRSENIPGVASNTWWVAATDGGNLPPDVEDALDQYRAMVLS